MTWTIKHLEQLKKKGLIREFRITSTSKKSERREFLKKKGKQKYWMELNLQAWCSDIGVELVPEYQFLLHRKFRFDWAIPSMKIAVEYEGIFGGGKSRHTTVTGYSRDSEKYNAAHAGGWRVFRYTAMTYKNLLKELNELCGSGSMD